MRLVVSALRFNFHGFPAAPSCAGVDAATKALRTKFAVKSVYRHVGCVFYVPIETRRRFRLCAARNGNSA